MLPTYLEAQEAKQQIVISFSAEFGDHEIQLGEPYDWENETVSITALKYYISNLKLKYQGQVVYLDNAQAQLIDYSIPESKQIRLEIPEYAKFDEVSCNLGIDSAMNVSGALDGDLDPTKGMYWTWQSGYVNFKVEGFSSAIASKDGKFMFHLGGYLSPNLAVQSLNFSVDSMSEINFLLDLDQLLRTIDLNENSSVMSPSLKDVELSESVAQSIRIHE